ncbi:glycerol-3-phosphate responsive antiterminator [Thermotalea metallivorans]|uniref:Glycerol uptake operon antiterminator regulatory protein n=1 Tax=Thermotalea metallivorans TaxID=520762 RepID=A0A140KZE8_9FIRM|nr:glycerol-3-phosphate responsive antiterminator [Thermotalea metallivorans]KXG73673.1 Glycerol uptake operon antiterminator regulatory protein [Thermotalea metallivorans]
MGNKFYYKVQENPIIAAVNHPQKLDPAIQSPCEIVFLMAGNIFNLKGIVDRVKGEGMSIYIHIDLMEGFSKDVVALKYIHEMIGPDGIITTKSNLIKITKELNMFAIQRLFILDSLSLETGIKSIHSSKPDAVEILPGIMPKITQTIHQETKIPVIAGGLIQDKEDVIESLKAGAMAISTSKEEIWFL